MTFCTPNWSYIERQEVYFQRLTPICSGDCAGGRTNWAIRKTDHRMHSWHATGTTLSIRNFRHYLRSGDPTLWSDHFLGRRRLPGEWYRAVPSHSASPEVALRLIDQLTIPARETSRVELGVGFSRMSSRTREANDRRGPVDFKVSRGSKDKTLFEFKLARISQLHKNLPASSQLDGHKDLILIDARKDNKPSGSKSTRLREPLWLFEDCSACADTPEDLASPGGFEPPLPP